MRPRTRSAFALVAGLSLFVLSACSAGQDGANGAAAPAATSSASEQAALLEDNGLAGLDAREVIEQLDTLPQQRPLDIGASVQEKALLLTDGETETVMELPVDEQYVSIAPFVNQTHDCFFHSLGTCQGELTEEDLTFTITTDSGEVLVDETVTTYANGFAGFWLPKDVEGTITVTNADGLEGSVPFETSNGSATCITTLQLQ